VYEVLENLLRNSFERASLLVASPTRN